jgi:hypothetical protein
MQNSRVRVSGQLERREATNGWLARRSAAVSTEWHVAENPAERAGNDDQAKPKARGDGSSEELLTEIEQWTDHVNKHFARQNNGRVVVDSIDGDGWHDRLLQQRKGQGG